MIPAIVGAEVPMIRAKALSKKRSAVRHRGTVDRRCAHCFERLIAATARNNNTIEAIVNVASTEAGLLTAMAYVDLNPIRAGIARTPETSKFTSIYERIQAIKKQPTHQIRLRKFVGQAPKERTLPCSQADYFALLDWTGRAIRGDKRGHIDQDLPPILTRLNIDPAAWEATMQPEGNVFGRAMGQLDHLRLHAKALGQSWIRGVRHAERLYRVA